MPTNVVLMLYKRTADACCSLIASRSTDMKSAATLESCNSLQDRISPGLLLRLPAMLGSKTAAAASDCSKPSGSDHCNSQSQRLVSTLHCPNTAHTTKGGSQAITTTSPCILEPWIKTRG